MFYHCQQIETYMWKCCFNVIAIQVKRFYTSLKNITVASNKVKLIQINIPMGGSTLTIKFVHKWSFMYEKCRPKG